MRALSTLALLLLTLTTGCNDVSEPCVEDADCSEGLCIHDLDRGDQYCSHACDQDLDCPVTQTCATHLSGADDEEDVLYMCVERVRHCGAVEICNGLDDDCNGETDDACATLSCLDDVSCGGVWPCTPSDGGSSFVCAPPQTSGAPPGAPCTVPADCYNGLCEIGQCAALCRDDDTCGVEQRCAEPSTPGAPKPHGACHRACDKNTPCPDGEACALRFNRWRCYLRPVCAPVRGTLLDGASCTDHDQCASASCIRGQCTRPCSPMDGDPGEGACALWRGSSCQYTEVPDVTGSCVSSWVDICR